MNYAPIKMGGFKEQPYLNWRYHYDGMLDVQSSDISLSPDKSQFDSRLKCESDKDLLDNYISESAFFEAVKDGAIITIAIQSEEIETLSFKQELSATLNYHGQELELNNNKLLIDFI